MSNDLAQVRLKGVVECQFNRSEVSNLHHYRATAYFPGELAVGEAFLFLSKKGDQVMFVFALRQVDCQGKPRAVMDSRRLRLSSGAWNPYMLQNYANEVGLHLVGIKRFEHIYVAKQKTKPKGGR